MEILHIAILMFLCKGFTQSLTIPVPDINVTNNDGLNSYRPREMIDYQVEINNIFWTTLKDLNVSSYSDVTNKYTDIQLYEIHEPSDEGDSELEFIYRDMSTELSDDGAYSNIIMRTRVKCIGNSKTNLLSFKISSKMRDNPAFDNGDPVRAVIAVEVEDEFIFIYEESLFKINNDNDTSFLGINSLGGQSSYFPGSNVKVSLTLSVNGYQTIPYARLTVYFPNSIQVLPDKDLYMKVHKDVVGFDMQKNIVTITVQSLDPGAEIYDFHFYAIFSSENMYPLYYFKRIITKVDITYCPYKTCDRLNPMKTITTQVNRYIYPSFVPDVSNPIRIKDANSGKCWRLHSIALTTSCKDHYNWFPNGSIMHTITKRYLPTSAFEVYLYTAYHVMGYQNSNRGFVMQDKGNQVKRSYYTRVYRTVSRHDKFKILTGLNNPDGVILKSVVYESSDKAIYLCNPGGDLANRPNCFYTSNLATSWKILPSAVTNIIFITTSPSVLYAKCHRGKMHCSVIMHADGSNQIQFQREEDWTKIRYGGTAVESYSFDEEDLTEEVREVWPGEIIGVSSGGIHFSKEGVWKKVFFWGN